MVKYICVHGHFYQPPRENPWLEEIEEQDSAYPYHDWNERITAECYSPNTAARIQSIDKKVIDISNNYSRISFNFGPTLLSWMENHTPDIYKGIIKADEESRKKYSGHGSAIAQVYNHMIMPLSNTRDKRTQVIWGIEDFKFRFGRMPEGMWLAETAVDYESLEILAEQGIRFTILAPRQAKCLKKIKDTDWVDVTDSKIDPRIPYVCKLPSGKTITLFFYDGPISQEIAFGDLLKNGENLANRLKGTLDQDDNPQIAHIATDGETYGHHQKHGDMALAWCLHFIEENETVNLTIYGEYLEKFPPDSEVQIIENSSWSCVHGVERWRSDCGCNAGHPGWNQAWRAPLRETLDWLREELIPVYEKAISKYEVDPWVLRDGYIEVILNREGSNINKFFSKHIKKELSKQQKVELLKYLELQRHTMLMYTSCGWFFDEISGIETVQVILYAARAIQLAKEIEGIDLDPEFARRLESVPSNIAEVGNGKNVYEMYVKPAIIDFFRVAAHYAISTLFEDYLETSRIFCYEVISEKLKKMEAGKYKMILGKSKLRSHITQENSEVSFTVLHMGDHNILGGVRETVSNDAFNKMAEEISLQFENLNLAEIIRLIDENFGNHNYNLWHLFKDESRKVFNILLKNTLEDIENSFRHQYENYYPIMNAILQARLTLPKALATAVEYVLNTDLQNLFKSEETINQEKLERIFSEIRKWKVPVDKTTLAYIGSNRINRLLEILQTRADDKKLLDEINTSLQILIHFDLQLDLWKAQNIMFVLSRQINEKNKINANGYDKDWKEKFNELSKNLQLNLNAG